MGMVKVVCPFKGKCISYPWKCSDCGRNEVKDYYVPKRTWMDYYEPKRMLEVTG